ncbi:alkaline phosphatase family protein, partial [Undibacterium luofuense]|uniref:alkaline phosphatase family protein n=1 Tax=Undibacterium luofuense TaxID=2828733 RepID=UPI0030EC5D1F
MQKNLPAGSANSSTEPEAPQRRQLLKGAALAGLSGGFFASTGTTTAADQPVKATSLDAKLKQHIQNVVIIYLENRSFNNLFANFPGLAKPLSGLSADAYLQKDRDGSVLPQLPKIWGGMVPRSQNIGGKQYSIGEDKITGLENAPFTLKDETGKPLPESVITRDLCHLFYQNQMQINGGKNDQFVAYGDSGALVMGYYG